MQKISTDPVILSYVEGSLSRDTIPEFFSASSSNEGGGKNDCLGGNRGDTKKESNRSSAKRTRAICKLNFHSLKEIFRISTSNKFEEPKLLCLVQTFQNGRYTSIERAPQGGGLSLRTGS